MEAGGGAEAGAKVAEKARTAHSCVGSGFSPSEGRIHSFVPI